MSFIIRCCCSTSVVQRVLKVRLSKSHEELRLICEMSGDLLDQRLDPLLRLIFGNQSQFIPHPRDLHLRYLSDIGGRQALNNDVSASLELLTIVTRPLLLLIGYRSTFVSRPL
jgi:hypothetical protein